MILAAGSPFDPVYNFFGSILAFFYSLIPNLGVAIILLTVLVMLVMFPLTAKQAKSMMAMQRAQPEIKKLQAKYKNDRAKLNEEMMKFYQENKINPLAGCLPLLIQMPIFLALFRVMREPYKHIPKSSELYAAFCTTKDGVLHTRECNVPKLGLPNPLYFLNLDLSLSATQAKGAFIDTLPYFVLVGLVILTGFLQARQSRRNAPNMNSQMAMVTTILPIGFGLFSLGFPSGLVLYFFVSNLWRLGQQEVIMHKITKPGQEAIKAAQQGAIDVEGADSGGGTTTAEKPSGGGLRRLFQLPAASDTTSGTGTKASPKAGGGASKSGGTKSGGGSAAGKSSGGNAQAGAARRRNNKKRKKR
jgi:YidC/Oxa1 family membrane protein insertase